MLRLYRNGESQRSPDPLHPARGGAGLLRNCWVSSLPCGNAGGGSNMTGCTCSRFTPHYCSQCQALAARAGLLLPQAPGATAPTEGSEASLETTLRTYLSHTGYLAYHTHNSKRSAPGFPDWAIIHPDGGPLFLWELKSQSQGAQPSPAQRRWLEALAKATTVE